MFHQPVDGLTAGPPSTHERGPPLNKFCSFADSHVFHRLDTSFQIGVYGAKKVTEAMDEATEATEAMEAVEEVTAATVDPTGLGQARGASSRFKLLFLVYR